MTYKKEGEQVKNLQMVEIDHNKFAVEMNDGNVSVNLTKMAKPFGKSKQPINWLRTQPAKEYINALSDMHICGSADLVQVRKGGKDEQGTWANDYRIAMRFAQWLSPNFSIQVDELLVNLMKDPKKQLAKSATKPVNEVYQCQMGDTMTDCYYTKGVIYTRFSKLLTYLVGNSSGTTPQLREKIGVENFIERPIHKQPIQFGNQQAFERFCILTNKKPSSAKYRSVLRDVFDVEIEEPVQDDESYTYKFTDAEMNMVLMELIKSPISKSSVAALLKNGYKEGGVE